jgi:hypothetical protein
MDKPVKKRYVFAAVLAAFLLFLFWAPGNHMEAEDAFEYSRQIEQVSGAGIFHPHHLFYIPSAKAVFSCFRCLGYEGRAYHVARGISTVSGIISVGLMYVLGRRLFPGDKSRSASYLSAGAMLFSYGFWRYSCETEIYAPALMLALGCLVLVTQPHAKLLCLVCGILAGAVAILIHVLNVVPVLLVPVGFYVFSKRESRNACWHMLGVSFLVCVVYFFVWLGPGFQNLPEGTVKDGGLVLMTIPRSLVGLGQSILSANFIFAYESVAQFLQKFFPYRVFTEELYLAARISFLQRTVYSMTFIVGICSLVILWLRLVGLFVKKQRCVTRWILLAWLLAGVVPVVWLEPSNPELWILVLPPLWLLVGKLYSSSKYSIPWGILCVLLLHNSTAGIGLIRDKRGDYNAEKAQWIVEHTTVNDVVYTADSYVFSFYLDYWSRGCVINLHGVEDFVMTEGHIYLLDDCFNIPQSLLVRWPESSRRIELLMAKIKGESLKIYDDEFGGVWQLQ